MIEVAHPELSVARQCELLELARSSYYFRPQGESDENLALMHLIDEVYTRWPFFGVPKMTAWLQNQGHVVNHKRVERLMRLMGLRAIYCKPKLSRGHPGHKKYPYLLRELRIVRPDQVWCTDITYIRMRLGFAYLVAIMDWYSRFVLSWTLSISMDTEFCLAALQAALGHSRPDIFNTDQGAQFTSEAFTGYLLDQGIRISMDGRGRVFDNIFVERLWRSVKYEEVYLQDYATVWEAEAGLDRYFEFYNHERPHQALDYKTPAQVYADKNGKGVTAEFSLSNA
jgi:putative transposase